MADDSTTSLKIEVLSIGIKDASDSLDKLTASAGKTETRVNSLTSSLAKLTDVFSSNLASTQAYAGTVASMADAALQRASGNANKQVDIEAKQWEKLTQQYDRFQQDRVAKIQAQIEKEDTMRFNAAAKAYAQAQAEANRMNAEFDAAAKRKESIAQRATAQAESLRQKSLQAEEAYQQRLQALDINYLNATLSAKQKILEKAMTMQGMGASKGDVAGKFGSVVASTATVDGLKAVKTQLEEGEKAAHAFSLANAGVVRELVIMGHEAATGNFSRLGGSMTVLANRSGALPGLIQSIGVAGIAAFGALALGIGAVVTLLVEGAFQADNFNRALTLTGNYAGATKDSLNAMAESIQTGVTGGVGTAKELLAGLASSGHFTSETLQSVGQAALNFKELSGKSSSEVIQFFDGMKNGVSAWAEEANKSYHFIDAASMAHVMQLEKEGKSNEALIEVLKRFNSSLDTTTEKIGYVEMAVRGWGLAYDALKEKILSWGAGETVGEQAQAATKKVNDLAEQLKNMGALDPARQRVKDQLRVAVAEEMRITSEAAKAQNDAQLKSEKAQIDSKAISALKEVEIEKDKYATMSQQRDTYAKHVKQLQADINTAARVDENGIAISMSDKAVQDLIDNFNSKHKDPKGREDDPRKQILEGELNSVKAKFDKEEEVYKSGIAEIDKLEQNHVIGAYEAYQRRETLRNQEVDSYRRYYDSSSDLLANYNNRTDTEAARTQGELDKIYQDALLHEQKMGDIGKQDKSAANEKSNKRTDTLLLDAAKLKEQSDALLSYGRAGKETNVQLEQQLILKEKLDPLAQSEIINNRLAAAAQKDVMQSYVDIDTVMAKLQQDEDARNEASLQGVAGTESAKIIKWEESKDKFLEFAKERGEAAIRADLLTGKISYPEAQKALDDLQAKFDKTMAKVKSEAQIKLDVSGLKDAGSHFEALGNSMSKMTGDMKQASGAVKDIGKAFDSLAAAQAIEGENATASAQQRIGAYGDMAAAAEGFFGQNTAGYKTMQVVSAAFHAFEMAIEAETMIRKLTLTAATTEAKVGAIGVETAANVASVPVNVAADGAKATASGIAGVAKSIASLPFPFNLAAGAATIAALMAVGVKMVGSVGGGSVNPNSAAEVQKVQGTGTVLGDDTAKSKSIADTLNLMKDMSSTSLDYSSQMVSSLHSIQNGIAGLTNVVARTTGLTSGSNMNIQTGTVAVGGQSGFALSPSLAMMDSLLGTNIAGTLNKVADKLTFGLLGKVESLWGKTTKDITDSGLSLQGTLAQLAAGQGVSQYANVHTDSSSYFGLHHSGSDSMQYQSLDPAVAKQFAAVFSNIDNTILTAGKSLGVDGSVLKNSLDNMYIDLSKISLKDLKGQDLQNAIQDVISKTADQAASLVASAKEFAKVGEGSYETLIRVATGVEQAHYALKQLNITAIDYTQIVNKQGDVATELIRQSLEAKQSGTSLVTVLQAFDGTAQDLISTYKKLTDIQANMKVSGLGMNNLSTTLIDAAGGVESLQSAMNTFTQNFFTDAQKQQMGMSKLKDEFHAMGLAMPSTREEFATTLQGLMSMGDAGQATAGKMLQLAGAFDEFEKQVDTSLNTARSNLTDAYNREKSAITDTQTKFQDFAKTLKDFQASLLTGSLSPLTNVEKYAQAKAQYEDTLKKAQAGDQTAISSFQNVADSFLNASRGVNASGAGYTADFNSVATATASLADYSSQQVDVATAQLEALDKQVNGLITINTSVLTVAQAIDALHQAMAQAGMVKDNFTTSVQTASTQPTASTGALSGSPLSRNGGLASIALGATMTAINGSHAAGLGYVPFDGYIAELHKGERVLTANENSNYKFDFANYGRKADEALVEEIKSLRQELTQLRQEQAQQIGQLIVSNYDANERAADKVVDGTKGAMTDAAWKSKSGLSLV